MDSNFFDIIIRDLERWNLLTGSANKHSTGVPSNQIDLILRGLISIVSERTTGFGRKFIKFIREPE